MTSDLGRGHAKPPIWRRSPSFDIAVGAAPNRHFCRSVVPAALGMPARLGRSAAEAAVLGPGRPAACGAGWRAHQARWARCADSMSRVANDTERAGWGTGTPLAVPEAVFPADVLMLAGYLPGSA